MGHGRRSRPERPEMLHNPILRFLFRKAPGPLLVPEPTTTGEPLAIIEIYYPEKTVETVISSRRTANMIVSTGIIGALILSSITLSRLYVRANSLRER
jgi:hypothetical protein